MNNYQLQYNIGRIHSVKSSHVFTGSANPCVKSHNNDRQDFLYIKLFISIRVYI